MRRLVLMTVFLLVPLAHSGAARPLSAAEEQSRRLYQAGTDAFHIEDYPEAIKQYKAAFKLIPKPFFLYNIAQAYRLAGDPAEAALYYRNFLSAMPNAPNRAEAEAQLAEVEAKLAMPKQPEHVPIPSPAAVTVANPGTAPAPPPADHARPIYKKWWFWTGLVVAAGATAAVVVLASGKASGPPTSELGNFAVYR